MSFTMNSGFSTKRRHGTLGGFILALLVLAFGAIAAANDSGVERADKIEQQLNQIKTDESAEQSRVQRDERAIRQLEQQLLNWRVSTLRSSARPTRSRLPATS
jgi:septal ring factor EnvC (AmiA/AmiB activator)